MLPCPVTKITIFLCVFFFKTSKYFSVVNRLFGTGTFIAENVELSKELEHPSISNTIFSRGTIFPNKTCTPKAISKT